MSGSSMSDSAPGLKRRKRADGWARYWIPPTKDIRAGYAPKSITIPDDMTDDECAARCRELWADLEIWRSGRPKVQPHTIAFVIDQYMRDPDSPFNKVMHATRKNYEQECRTIAATVGERRIDPLIVGGVYRPRIIGSDIWRWHREWGLPDKDGVITAPSRQRHMISMLRGLMTYAVTTGIHGAAEVRAVLEAMEFPTPRARTTAPSREQVYAIAETCVAEGWTSMAIATLAQFELTERRIHIIGQWEVKQWRPGWLWSGLSRDWVISYTQAKRAVVEREFDLRELPVLLKLLQSIPPDQRVGPIVRCETTGEPWRKRFYCDTFREMARQAGVPDGVWSMDMRAGGATEADGVAEITPRMLQDGMGHAELKTQDRYRRAKQRNAQKVVQLRQKARSE